MLEVLASPLVIVFVAVLYGTTMKIADLLDEHGLKLFKGSPVLFGVLWGLFGVFLVLGNNVVANVVLAMNIAFIIRRRLDYINHQIAASIVLIVFLMTASFDFYLFGAFYIIFLVFGSLKDYVDDTLKMKEGLLVTLNEAMLYYPVPTLIYAILFGNWVLFYVFLVYTLSYDLTKLYAKSKGYD